MTWGDARTTTDTAASGEIASSLKMPLFKQRGDRRLRSSIYNALRYLALAHNKASPPAILRVSQRQLTITRSGNAAKTWPGNERSPRPEWPVGGQLVVKLFLLWSS